jgi:hypothetical protein
VELSSTSDTADNDHCTRCRPVAGVVVRLPGHLQRLRGGGACAAVGAEAWLDLELRAAIRPASVGVLARSLWSLGGAVLGWPANGVSGFADAG